MGKGLGLPANGILINLGRKFCGKSLIGDIGVREQIDVLYMFEKRPSLLELHLDNSTDFSLSLFMKYFPLKCVN